MKEVIVGFLGGLLFALGLGYGGMTSPAKVQGFLNILGNWDPSLLFVMGGAIAVHMPLQFLMKRRKNPLWSSSWHLPSSRRITIPLVLGALIFGFGWGLAGYCPGPAIVSLGNGSTSALIFTFGMFLGMFLFRKIQKKWHFQK